ncbi:hypothetical protein JYU20_00465 [Bacteroidales bacterium AH-315-I05]|nr:hypothetical protein [Bacteroidales bacterium AH-315-I05]
MEIILRDAGLVNEKYRIEPDSYVLVGNESKVNDILTVEKRGLELVNKETAGWRYKKNVKDKLKSLILTKMNATTDAEKEDDAKYALLDDGSVSEKDEQSVALNWFILQKESWRLAKNDDDKYWVDKASEYRDWTQDVRKEMVKRMESLIHLRLLYKVEVKDVLVDMWQILEGTKINLNASNETTKKVRILDLRGLFITDGIEGSLKDSAGTFIFNALVDFIDSTAKFAGKGFRNLTHTFRTGHTAGSVADELLTIKDATW